MLEDAGDRRLRDRRQGERRLLDGDEFLAAHAGVCERMRMRLTREGCEEIRNRYVPPRQCEDCPGVVLQERRRMQRRTDGDRRAPALG